MYVTYNTTIDKKYWKFQDTSKRIDAFCCIMKFQVTSK